MYVAVKGGEKAIDAAHALQESRRRGDTDLPELSVAQIEQQLNLAVDRVMTEGGIADRELAALALKQASGDNVEAIFLLRAYRTTLAKLAVSEPLDTTGMRLERRISAVYKDIPGGQLLGPTYDYTHRLLDFTLLANGEAPTLTTADSEQQPSPHVFSLLARQGLAKFEEDSGAQPDDITRTPPVYPCSRSSRLQQLMRGDEGYLLALAYSTQRGYGRNHPFAGEIRSGYIDVSIVPEELGFAVNVGELLMTECEMVNGFIDPPGEPPHFTRGYGLVFGMSERKAMAMALVDRALQAPEYGEHATGPAQDEEFVLAHADNVEAVATMIAEGGIYIEDYSDIEQQVAEIAHVDLIEQELLDKPRDTVIIHMYLEPGASPVETLALIQARMEAAGISYTVETEGVEQEDWQNGWRKYYHPMDIGSRLAIVPSWQEYDTDRVKLILDPGLAFGTGGHETTSLCLEALDERVRGGERVLDIGTGSGILAIAALKLGAGSAEGVDIDPVAVRTAGENAALNGVADKLTVLVGDLSDKASGRYDIITANIVANAIISLAPAVPGLMAENATFIASGIIDSRKDEVIAALEAAGLTVQEVKEKRGWECIICKKTN